MEIHFSSLSSFWMNGSCGAWIRGEEESAAKQEWKRGKTFPFDVTKSRHKLIFLVSVNLILLLPLLHAPCHLNQHTRPLLHLQYIRQESWDNKRIFSNLTSFFFDVPSDSDSTFVFRIKMEKFRLFARSLEPSTRRKCHGIVIGSDSNLEWQRRGRGRFQFNYLRLPFSTTRALPLTLCRLISSLCSARLLSLMNQGNRIKDDDNERQSDEHLTSFQWFSILRFHRRIAARVLHPKKKQKSRILNNDLIRLNCMLDFVQRQSYVSHRLSSISHSISFLSHRCSSFSPFQNYRNFRLHFLLHIIPCCVRTTNSSSERAKDHQRATTT